jgi:prolyl-tRNA editing enzyme YbaK/EbsC (Cys-tRNA(Pro) deacylase)
MRHLAIAPTFYLVELSDLGQKLPEPVNVHRTALEQIVTWAEDYLCRPHPELGREGPVCPFVQASMDKGLFFLAVCPGKELEKDAILESMVKYRDWFLEIEPRRGNDAIFKTILLLFPDLPLADAPRLIDATQESLKGEYVAKGLMIGEFHAVPPKKAGLWNPDFRPLNSPVPMLVIRHMVPSDFAFLKDDKESVVSYLQIHGDAVPVHLKEEVRQVVSRFGLIFEEPPLHPRVRAAMHKAGVAYKIHRHADQPFPIQGPADFARALGYPLGRITRSFLLRCQCHGKYLVVVCPVNKEPSLPQLARLVGCKRLELASPEELAIILGYPTQGVPPMAVASTQVLMDEDLLQYPTVLTAAGEVEIEVEVAPGDLRRLSRALLYSSRLVHDRKDRVAQYASGSEA